MTDDSLINPSDSHKNLLQSDDATDSQDCVAFPTHATREIRIALLICSFGISVLILWKKHF